MQNQLISNKKSPFPLGAWQLFTFYLHFSLLAQEAIKQAAVTSEGNHTLVVTDTSGNEITVKFTIDKTSTVVTGVSNNGLYKKDVIITFNEGTATLDGDDSTSGKTVTSEGSHTLVVTDAAGNATTVNFTIDKTAPNAPTVDTVTSKTTEVTGTAEANSTIVVKEGKDTIGIGKTDQDGKFTISIEKQKRHKPLRNSEGHCWQRKCCYKSNG